MAAPPQPDVVSPHSGGATAGPRDGREVATEHWGEGKGSFDTTVRARVSPPPSAHDDTQTHRKGATKPGLLRGGKPS